MFRTAIIFASLVLLASCATAPQISPLARSDLAPTGKLRVGINFGNVLLTAKDPASGEPRGVAVDLARELGRRLGVPMACWTVLNRPSRTRDPGSFSA